MVWGGKLKTHILNCSYRKETKGKNHAPFHIHRDKTMSPRLVLCNQGKKESAVVLALKGTVSVAVGT